MIQKNKGFSLIEVIIATVIIGILAAGMMSLISYSKRMSIRAQQKAAAVSIVEKKLNELKTQKPADLVIGQTEDPNIVISSGSMTTPGKLITTITSGSPPDPKMREVKVELQWKDPLGADRSETAVTLFYQE